MNSKNNKEKKDRKNDEVLDELDLSNLNEENNDDIMLPGLGDDDFIPEDDNFDDFEDFDEEDDTLELDDDEELEEVEELDEEDDTLELDDDEELEEIEELDEEDDTLELDDDEELEEVEELDEEDDALELDDDEELEEVEELDEEDDTLELDDDEELEEIEELDEEDDTLELDDDEELEEVEELDEEDDALELDDDEELEEVEELDEEDDTLELDDDEELEEVEELDEDDDTLELDDDEELEEVEELDEEDDALELDDDEELEEVEELDEDDDTLELDDDEELEEVEELDEEDDALELDDDEELEEVEELDEEDDALELDDDEELEEVDELDEEDDTLELDDDEELEEVEENKTGDSENIKEFSESENEDIENIEKAENLDEISEDKEQGFDEQEKHDENLDKEINAELENSEIENDEETKGDETDEDTNENTEEAEDEVEEITEILEEDKDDDEEESEEESMYPDELVDLELECIYIGLLFNNPKAMSRYYLKYDDCRFSDDELMNLYKIVLFRDGEAYAPAIAKDKFQLPRETPNTYDLKLKVRRIAAAKNYNLENVYIELKKLFILKKNYVSAATSAIQQKILEITNYELYADMTVEEVESALEQITVTTGLSQGRLNNDVTSFLLAGDNELSNGISIPFNILSTVFKGLRKGETMCYAMPSNSGKSRFTINLAAYISFIHKEKVLIISNEMSEEKMKLCMITTILNNPEIQKIHGQNLHISEGELLELKFRPDKGKRVKCDEDGYILRKPDETQEEYVEKLRKNSSDFRHTIEVTEWVNTQVNNSIFFIHITEHTNDDLRKIIMNYYYKEGIHYMFYDTLKADTANIGNSDEVKKTATILSNLAQKFKIFIASSMQLLESSTLPVNLTINDMSASKTAKEVLDTLCLIKQISRQSLHKYEYSDTDQFEKCYDIDVPKDTDVRFYACVVDKNRAGAKPTVLFRLNLAYNSWEELGHLRLKQTEIEED